MREEESCEEERWEGRKVGKQRKVKKEERYVGTRVQSMYFVAEEFYFSAVTGPSRYPLRTPNA